MHGLFIVQTWKGPAIPLFTFHWSELVTWHHPPTEGLRGAVYAGKGRKTRNWYIMITAIVGSLYNYPHVTFDKTEAREARLPVQSYTADIWQSKAWN